MIRRHLLGHVLKEWNGKPRGRDGAGYKFRSSSLMKVRNRVSLDIVQNFSLSFQNRLHRPVWYIPSIT